MSVITNAGPVAAEHLQPLPPVFDEYQFIAAIAYDAADRPPDHRIIVDNEKSSSSELDPENETVG
jgi:hypothetical protein